MIGVTSQIKYGLNSGLTLGFNKSMSEPKFIDGLYTGSREDKEVVSSEDGVLVGARYLIELEELLKYHPMWHRKGLTLIRMDIRVKSFLLPMAFCT